MATVIDALVVTLGLDGRGVTKGQQAVTGDMRRVEKQADHTGKTVADSGKAMGDSFRSVRTELLGLFALMTAGRGLKDFISSTTASNVAAGQLSHNLGMSTQSLTAWQKVAESTGGSASDMSSSLQSVVSQFQTIEGRRNLAHPVSSRS
ncbi:hypothetical protein NO263_07520 [Gluconacetobacter entanii]|uniref:Uncharacterized protein n=1 Tax=Gluconacetobacter entanii TaxID=108528 RepID=A0ABT3K4U3_9PROT|nr:hypothetical protein [Gluconacetobacter entanii]MCW4590425.1 hypothetical protein [Gluconacetobacter entanii]MCW4594343.1 hypothetical protein [Gluconacetobacter entanii]NPC88168.1 hypothetical protein [Gluconacetobacter entanii]